MMEGYGFGYPMMSWWYVVAVILTSVLGVWLSALVLRKAGHSPWWALLFLVPFLYLIGMWVFAFARWPRLDRVRVTPPSDYEGGWNIPDRPAGRTEDEPKPSIQPDPHTGRSWDNDRRQ